MRIGKLCKYFCLICLLTIFGAAFADSPLKPSSKLKISSANRKFIVTSDSKNGTVAKSNTGDELWRIPFQFQEFYIANDGIHFVSIYFGQNLIPISYKPDLVLITFWKNGKILKEITVQDLIPKKDILIKTASHYYWGAIVKLREDGNLVLRRADGVILSFDVRTGKMKTESGVTH